MIKPVLVKLQRLVVNDVIKNDVYDELVIMLSVLIN